MLTNMMIQLHIAAMNIDIDILVNEFTDVA